MDKQTLTIEEFRQNVKETFSALWPSLTDAEVEAYLSSDEAVEQIENGYKSNLLEYENGEQTFAQFSIGGAGSVGMCLSLMY